LGGTQGAPSSINYTWENYNRNKRSITLDLSKEQGQEILYKLVKTADVFLTNLRPFELTKFRVEYSTLSRLNPRLIYGSLNGYGKKGPERDAPGYDLTAYWHRAAIPYILSWPGQLPPYFQTAIGDNVAGLGLAFGVMMALYIREKTGTGQEVDLSLFHLGVYVNAFSIAAALVTGQEFDQWRRNTLEDTPNPLANFYRTKDERWLYILALQPDRYWSVFCKAIEREDLEHDPRFNSFQTRKENNITLYHILKDVFLSRPLAEWKSRLTEARFPFSPMQNLLEVCSDPQARANDFFTTIDHPTYGKIEVITNPINLSGNPASIRTPAPEIGQHTEEILLELGYTWENIVAFKDAQVI
jgi:crotonobetainyl-CoA:carnitine CoA-transferase CaiB-like acyl-CoA transferase